MGARLNFSKQPALSVLSLSVELSFLPMFRLSILIIFFYFPIACCKALGVLNGFLKAASVTISVSLSLRYSYVHTSGFSPCRIEVLHKCTEYVVYTCIGADLESVSLVHTVYSMSPQIDYDHNVSANIPPISLQKIVFIS